MKLVMDEKVKHRLIGLAVIISLGAIFAPAVMKKSSQNVESNFSVNIKLPPKPAAPNVAVADEQDMFKTIKVTRVEIPPVAQVQRENELAKAEPINAGKLSNHSEAEVAAVEPGQASNMEPIQLALNEAATDTAKKAIKVAETKPAKPPSTLIAKQTVAKPKPQVKLAQAKTVKVAKVTKRIPKPFVKKDVYAVQLASFSQLSNAQALVSKLHSKGYKANYVRIKGNNGSVYKVYAGHSPSKNEAAKYKTQLASSMQLNGFIVNTRVS